MTGDQADILSRLQRWLPQGWFPPDPGTRIYALLSGIASVLSSIYQIVAYVQLQTRLATATDGFLDLASSDFFGINLPRLNAETDALFSMRIRKEILRQRLTRGAIDQLLFDMTGAHPIITELQRPADVGGWGCPYLALGVTPLGSFADTLAVFVTCQHAGQFGIPNVGGWGGYLSGLGTPQFPLCDPSMVTGTGFSDADIYAALNRLRAAGITIWVRITDDVIPPPVPEYVLGTETGAALGTETGAELLI